jgi:hypothetical protein
MTLFDLLRPPGMAMINPQRPDIPFETKTFIRKTPRPEDLACTCKAGQPSCHLKTVHGFQRLGLNEHVKKGLTLIPCSIIVFSIVTEGLGTRNFLSNPWQDPSIICNAAAARQVQDSVSLDHVFLRMSPLSGSDRNLLPVLLKPTGDF